MIYTSYFSKLQYLPDTMTPVSICHKPPSWYKGWRYNALVANWGTLLEYKQSHNYDRYERRYRDETLAHLSAFHVHQDLCSIGTKDVVLLCYERPSDFCHRHIVAQWLTEHGYPCSELKF